MVCYKCRLLTAYLLTLLRCEVLSEKLVHPNTRKSQNRHNSANKFAKWLYCTDSNWHWSILCKYDQEIVKTSWARMSFASPVKFGECHEVRCGWTSVLYRDWQKYVCWGKQPIVWTYVNICLPIVFKAPVVIYLGSFSLSSISVTAMLKNWTLHRSKTRNVHSLLVNHLVHSFTCHWYSQTHLISHNLITIYLLPPPRRLCFCRFLSVCLSVWVLAT